MIYDVYICMYRYDITSNEPIQGSALSLALHKRANEYKHEPNVLSELDDPNYATKHILAKVPELEPEKVIDDEEDYPIEYGEIEEEGSGASGSTNYGRKKGMGDEGAALNEMINKFDSTRDLQNSSPYRAQNLQYNLQNNPGAQQTNLYGAQPSRFPTPSRSQTASRDPYERRDSDSRGNTALKQVVHPATAHREANSPANVNRRLSPTVVKKSSQSTSPADLRALAKIGKFSPITPAGSRFSSVKVKPVASRFQVSQSPSRGQGLAQSKSAAQLSGTKSKLLHNPLVMG